MLQLRAWAFLARFHAQAIIRSQATRAWAVALVRLELAALVALVALVVHVRLVPVVLVAQLVQAAHLVQVAHLVRLVPAQALLARVVLQVPVVAQDSLAQLAVAVAQRVVPVAVLVQPVPLARAVAVAKARLASQSVRNAKNLNKEVHLALVAQLCHVATAAQAFVCAAVLACKTLPTRLMAMPVS